MSSFSPEKLEELAKDPRNQVYTVNYDQVEYTPMREVKNLIHVVRSLSKALLSSYPEWSDDQIREEIAKRSGAAKKMKEKTHPKLFLKITDRNLSDDDAESLAYMISLYERKERGELSQEDVETAIYVKMLRDAGV